MRENSNQASAAAQTVLCRDRDLKIIERSIVSEVINRYNGNKSAAARALGLHRKTLYRILEDERTGPTEAPLVPS